MEKQENKKTKKVLSGKVVSNKMKDTVVVAVERFVKHPKLGKYYKIRKKFKAHDPKNECQIGDKIFIEETKPISKDKHFVLIKRME